MVGENFYGLDLEIMALFAQKLGKELYIYNMEFDAVCLSVSAAGGTYTDANGNEVTQEGGVCDIAAAGWLNNCYINIVFKIVCGDPRLEALPFSLCKKRCYF